MDSPPEANSVLLVEDDDDFRASLAMLVAHEGFVVREAGSLAEARASLEAQVPDLVLLDLSLPDGDGLSLRLEETMPPDTPFVVVTGDGSRNAADAARRQGATDVLAKPPDVEALRRTLHALQEGARLRREVEDLRTNLRAAGRFGRLVGRSAAMQRVYDLITRVAPTGAPVLITGESGTGKELAALTVHDMSPRAGGPFVALNCGAIPDTLVESRLFGHEKGAFTGAEQRHHGVFEQAHEGTLFLDEIGEMPRESQVRLLRVLETQTLTRVGGTEELRVDVRILAATNRNPQAAMSAGALREDLYHRLSVFPIHMPALRERPEDIPLIADHLIERVSSASGPRALSDAARARLGDHVWPGNVRELRNVVERAAILTDGVIPASAIHMDDGAAATVEARSNEQPRAPDEEAPSLEVEGVPPSAETDGEVPGLATNEVVVEIGAPLADAERRLILATLAWCGGNKRKTARTLGMGVKTLYSRLRDYGAEDA